MSHILDFIDDNDDGQNVIVGSSWDDLRTMYKNQFEMPVKNLCPTLATAIETCHQVLISMSYKNLISTDLLTKLTSMCIVMHAK